MDVELAQSMHGITRDTYMTSVYASMISSFDVFELSSIPELILYVEL